MGKIIRVCEDATRYAGIAATLAIMAIIACDVLFRYAFNAPLAWAYEFIALYLMAALFFLPLGYVQRCQGNVAVDLFVRVLPATIRSWLFRVGNLLAAATFAVTGMVFAEKAWDAAASGEEIIGPYVWTTWPIYAVVTLGLVQFVLRALYQVGQSATTLQRDAAEEAHGE
ncbi:TRAP transporter small permease [Vineibacter terrae]|uniref:TRAP transporter small permease protein n=1 Tax=Vineibacter terrae TaxID=2586908 RepID=A0A5C8PUD6_9HYPH|nr:TRAP transporter small permease [Vineibacter terrae]TXL81704.1 TRAP transporter small permease [Vineibacter terrae]